MIGTNTDGKNVLVNRDFIIHIPYGAAYEVFDATGDQLTVLTVTRFDEMPVDYTDGNFTPREESIKSDVLSFTLTHALSIDSLGQMRFQDFLMKIKKSSDERHAKMAIGSAADAENDTYRILKVVQDTPGIKAGYVTSDLFVAVVYTVFIFTRNHVYQATMKVPRQAQKVKRTGMYMMSLLSGIKAN